MHHLGKAVIYSVGRKETFPPLYGKKILATGSRVNIWGKLSLARNETNEMLLHMHAVIH